MTDAACAVRNSQPEEARQVMQSAFDELVQAKDNYHSTQHYFLELTLVTNTTLGEPLRQLLNEERTINLFLPSSVLAALPETNPETFALLKSRAEHIRFIVDDTESLSLSLLPILDVADHLLEGISIYRELLNVSPTVYGRLTTGLSPALPQLLKLSGLKGVLHFAPLAGWKLKEQEQSKIVWQGPDTTTIDAIVRYPIDASSFLGFFELADQLNNSTNHDSVPTSVFALFPGQKSVWLDTLRRMTRFTTGLGKFVGADDYFSDTAYNGSLQRFGYEKYPESALTEVGENPLSRWNELYRHNSDRLVQSSLETMLQLLNHPLTETPLVQQFVEAIHPQECRAEASNPLPVGKGRMVVNPLSFARKVFVDDIAVDVPPLGYAYVEPTAPTAAPARKSLLGQFLGKKNDPVLARKAEETIGRKAKRSVFILENRYFSAKFDALTGALRSIFTNRSRYNQLSRQIAFRNNRSYSVQVAEEIVLTKATSEVGQIKIAGRLVFPEGEVAARFTETVTIHSQSRLLEFDLTLDPLVEMEDNRWHSYIAVRYAWNDDTLEMRGILNDGVHVLSDRTHLHAPKGIDLRHETGALTFFSEGLPFHRRSGERQLDTLLIVKGESQRQFRMGIAVNAQHPALLSQDFLLPPFVVPVSCRPKNPSSWLFQIESKNVVALHWEPVYEAEQLVGCMVYLQEVEGRKAHFALRSFLPPNQAAATDLLGKERKTFKVDADAAFIDMHAYELLPLLLKTTDSTATRPETDRLL
jgi:alpha-mannosidase